MKTKMIVVVAIEFEHDAKLRKKDVAAYLKPLIECDRSNVLMKARKVVIRAVDRD